MQIYSRCEVYRVKDFLEEVGADADVPDDWYEYRVWLIDKKTGEVVSEWDSLFETYDGLHKLTKEQAEQSMMEVIEDVNERCDWEGWFDII